MSGRQVNLLTGVVLRFLPKEIQCLDPDGGVVSFPYLRAVDAASLLILAGREENLARIQEILAAYRFIPQIHEQIVIANPALDPSPLHRESSLKWVSAPCPEDILPTSLKEGLRALSSSSQWVIVVLANRPLLPAASLTVLLEAALQTPDRIIVPLLANERAHPLILPRSVAKALLRTRKEKGLLYYVKRQRREIPL